MSGTREVFAYSNGVLSLLFFSLVVISHRLSKVHHGIAQSDVIKKDSIILVCTVRSAGVPPNLDDN